jgi:hypothetical protein
MKQRGACSFGLLPSSVVNSGGRDTSVYTDDVLLPILFRPSAGTAHQARRSGITKASMPAVVTNGKQVASIGAIGLFHRGGSRGCAGRYFRQD